MILPHILTQIQNSDYLIDYSKSNFGYSYAILYSLKKGLIIKIDIGKVASSSLSWIAEIDSKIVGSGLIIGVVEVENVLDIINCIVEEGTEDLEYKLMNQF